MNGIWIKNTSRFLNTCIVLFHRYGEHQIRVRGGQGHHPTVQSEGVQSGLDGEMRWWRIRADTTTVSLASWPMYQCETATPLTRDPRNDEDARDKNDT